MFSPSGLLGGAPNFMSHNDLIGIHLIYETDFASKFLPNTEPVQSDRWSAVVAKKYVV